MTKPAFLHAFARPAADREAYIKIVRGDGAVVWDDLGNRYVDGLASLWYCNVGHGRSEIADAVALQMQSIAAFHTFESFTNEPAEQLTEKLAAMAPMPEARVFLTSGGSESVDTAMKLARFAHHVSGAPERHLIISRKPSYHGTTFGGMTATGLPLNQDGYGPLVPDVLQVPYDDLGALDEVLAERGHELAAILAEPVVGAGGVYPAPPGYLAGLRERCDRHGGFLIFDEVITGFGRLGRWWGAQHVDVVPDLVTFAKGVTSGYQPVGGVLVGKRVRDRIEADPSLLLRHGYTYGGHPTACAAALANLAIIDGEGLVERAVKVGDRLRRALEAVVDGEHMTSVRGDGAMWAVGLGGHVNAIEVRDEMLPREVIARPIGPDAMAFCPPLVIGDADLDRCATALAEAVAVVAAKA
jgi:adenosylmethionine-8-amino-7-oxononanoate aminotransferase